MTQNICLDKKDFQRMENKILKDVLNISRSMIETFKFRVIYGLNIESSELNKTLSGLSEFRKKNWDNKLSRNEAYKKYLTLD